MMTFTSEQLATLRKIAQQATQGEWRAFISPDTGTYAVHTPGDERCGDITNGLALTARKMQRTTQNLSQLSTLK